jgi:hypothetical protein
METWHVECAGATQLLRACGVGGGQGRSGEVRGSRGRSGEDKGSREALSLQYVAQRCEYADKQSIRYMKRHRGRLWTVVCVVETCIQLTLGCRLVGRGD